MDKIKIACTAKQKEEIVEKMMSVGCFKRTCTKSSCGGCTYHIFNIDWTITDEA